MSRTCTSKPSGRPCNKSPTTIRSKGGGGVGGGVSRPANAQPFPAHGGHVPEAPGPWTSSGASWPYRSAGRSKAARGGGRESGGREGGGGSRWPCRSQQGMRSARQRTASTHPATPQLLLLLPWNSARCWTRRGQSTSRSRRRTLPWRWSQSWTDNAGRRAAGTVREGATATATSYAALRVTLMGASMSYRYLNVDSEAARDSAQVRTTASASATAPAPPSVLDTRHKKRKRSGAFARRVSPNACGGAGQGGGKRDGRRWSQEPERQGGRDGAAAPDRPGRPTRTYQWFAATQSAAPAARAAWRTASISAGVSFVIWLMATTGFTPNFICTSGPGNRSGAVVSSGPAARRLACIAASRHATHRVLDVLGQVDTSLRDEIHVLRAVLFRELPHTTADDAQGGHATHSTHGPGHPATLLGHTPAIRTRPWGHRHAS